MPSDPGNMPFQRAMPYGEASTHDDTADTSPADAGALHAEHILLQEFNRANVTAYQLRDERTRTFNAALVQTGIVISALTALESVYILHPLGSLTGVGILASLYSVVSSFVYFARLFVLGTRIQDSMITMNVIKEFYIQQLHRQVPQLDQAFHWRLSDTRAIGQSDRMPLLMSLSVSLAGSAFFSFAVTLIQAFQRELATPGGGFFHQETLADVVVTALAFGVALLAFLVFYVALEQRYGLASMLRTEADKFGLAVPHAKMRAGG